MTHYSLDTSAAREADNRSGRITEIGKYIGMFTRAEDTTSQRGTKGIEFAFETPSHQTANFTIYTYKSTGEPLPGFSQIQALMTCLHVRNMEAKTAPVRKWDSVAGKVIDTRGEVFEALMNKRVGVLFETEDYPKKDGSIGTKVMPAYFFDGSTELVASEILDKKTTPMILEKLVKSLRHRPMRNSNGTPNMAGYDAAFGAAKRPSYDDGKPMPDDDVDDIPF